MDIKDALRIACHALRDTYSIEPEVVGGRYVQDKYVAVRFTKQDVEAAEAYNLIQEHLKVDGFQFREAGVWEPDGSRFKTYREENLDGVAMYVKEPV